MLPTIESAISNFKQLVPNASGIDRLVVSQPYNNKLEKDMLWYMRNMSSRPHRGFQSISEVSVWSADAPFYYLRNDILYLEYINTLKSPTPVSNVPDWVMSTHAAETRCHTDLLFKQFIAHPSKQTQQKLTQYIAQVLYEFAQIEKNQGNLLPEIKQHQTYFKSYKKQFKTEMIRITKRLVNTYLGLLPLRLDVWAVLFIVNQLPEFDLIYDGTKVRIYERMRLFQEKCLAKVVGRSYCSVQ